MKRYSLVCVDVQPLYTAARRKNVLENCRRLFLQAVKDNAAIIIVEYDGAGSTNKNLLSIANGYGNSHTVIKEDDDGSREVYDVLVDNKLPKNLLKVCGVNTDMCVHATVKGLSKRLPASEIHVIADACATSSLRERHTEALNKMAALGNVMILES